MSFEVNPDALFAYGEQLHRYASHADHLHGYVDTGALSVSNFSGWSLVADVLSELHRYHVERTRVRIDEMKRVSYGSAEGLKSAAHFYLRTDKNSAAELDSKYPATATGHGTPAEPDPRPLSEVFADVMDPVAKISEQEAADKGDDLGIQMSEVEEELDMWANCTSIAYWIRRLVKKVSGHDPVDDAIQTYSFDWTAWVEAAKAWRRCGGAVDTMANNARRYTKLADYWSGNAHGAANDYLMTFVNATETEEGYYRDYLFPFYSSMAEQVYQAHQAVSAVINAIVDALVTLGMAKAVKMVVTGEAADLINHIKECVTFIKIIIKTAQNLVKDRDALHRGEEPACEMAQIPEPYDHPEKEW